MPIRKIRLFSAPVVTTIRGKDNQPETVVCSKEYVFEVGREIQIPTTREKAGLPKIYLIEPDPPNTFTIYIKGYADVPVIWKTISGMAFEAEYDVEGLER